MTLLIKDITELKKIFRDNICWFLIEAENIYRTQRENNNKIYYICFVDNEQQCCEDFCYLSTPDDYKSFIALKFILYEVIYLNIDEQN